MGDLVAHLTDGPCLGTYEVARTPTAMRATVDRRDGRTFVLDLVDDVAEPTEDLYVYRRTGVGHACGPRLCSRFVSYEFVGGLDRETGEILQPAPAQLAWWSERARAALRAWAFGLSAPHEGGDEQQQLF